MKSKTAWEKSDWYDQIVKDKGHYYHREIVLPKALTLLRLKKNDRLLDLGCGSAPLAKKIPKSVYYLGVDASHTLITKAKQYHEDKNRQFVEADATKKFPAKKDFTHATFLLSLQNMENSAAALQNAYSYLQKNGKLLLVLNHPCFRIPRQSSWEIDRDKKIQSRKVQMYMSSLTIPIQTQPGKNPKDQVWAFHRSLSAYSQDLFSTGFVIEKFEEWTSNKKSTGKYAKMENRAREEFPLFLAILAKKL